VTGPRPGERWTVNGVDLICPAWSLDPSKGRKGLAMTPALRDLSVSVPGRRGVLTAPGVVYDAGVLVFNLWILGVDPDTGDVPDWSSTQEQLGRNIDTLTGLFHAPTLDIRSPSGRRTVGTLSQPLDATSDALTRPAYAELSVAVRIDDAFWSDADEVASSVVFATSGQVQPLYEFTGATAPMDDLDITIGPVWNPVLTDPVSGSWVAYDGIVAAGEALRLDCAARRVYGDGGLFVDQALVRRGGARGRLFELAPGNPPRIVVESSGPDPVSVQVVGRRSYLTA
jgi:hypothetical protein